MNDNQSQNPEEVLIPAEEALRRRSMGMVVSSTSGASDALKRRKKPATFLATEIFQADFDSENFASASLRANLSRGDNLEEKTLRLKEVHPDGDLEVLEKSIVMGIDKPALLYRESPQQQWKLIEPEGFINDGKVDWADIREGIAPSREALIGETAAFIATKNPLGNVLKLLGTQFWGAFAGESVEQAYQSLTGLQAQTGAEILGEAGMEGGAALAGGAVGSVFIAPYNVVRGAGALRSGPGGEEILRSMNRLSPELGRKATPGIISDNPFVIFSEKQAASILPAMGRRYRELALLFDDAVKKIYKTPEKAGVANKFITGLKEYSDRFLNKIKVAPASWRQGGQTLQSFIDVYKNTSETIVSAAYAAARQVEEPTFVLSTLYGKADDVMKGAYGKVDGRIATLIEDLKAIDGPVELSDGVLSVTQQLRNVRTGLFDVQFSGQEVGGQYKGQAKVLLKEINNALNNPTNTNPLFRSLWKVANSSAAERFSKLEKAQIVKAVRSETPAKLAKDLAKPYEVDNLLVVRDTIDVDGWNAFRDSFYSDLLDDPRKLSSTLDSFDKETLDVLMPRNEQVLWRDIGTEMDRVFSISADEIIERQVFNKAFVGKVIESADPRMAVTIRKAFRSPTTGAAMRDSFRPSIMEWAWEGAIQKTKRGIAINQGKLEANVKRLKDAKLWSLLSGKQQQALTDAETVTRAFGSLTDAGTSLLAASAVAGVREASPSAIKTFAENFLVNRLYLSDVGRKILIGSGKKHTSGKTLRLLLGALAQIGPPEDIETLLKEQEANK